MMKLTSRGKNDFTTASCLSGRIGCPFLFMIKHEAGISTKAMGSDIHLFSTFFVFVSFISKQVGVSQQIHSRSCHPSSAATAASCCRGGGGGCRCCYHCGSGIRPDKEGPGANTERKFTSEGRFSVRTRLTLICSLPRADVKK